ATLLPPNFCTIRPTVHLPFPNTATLKMIGATAPTARAAGPAGRRARRGDARQLRKANGPPRVVRGSPFRRFGVALLLGLGHGRLTDARPVGRSGSAAGPRFAGLSQIAAEPLRPTGQRRV